MNTTPVDDVPLPVCSHCGFALPKYPSGLRHYGTHTAHQESECLRLLHSEIARQRDVIGTVNARCDHLGMRLGEVIRERDALRAAAEDGGYTSPPLKHVKSMVCVPVDDIDALRADAERYRWLRMRHETLGPDAVDATVDSKMKGIT
jgi:hypothetical protein